jgi:hypothetical protein
MEVPNAMADRGPTRSAVSVRKVELLGTLTSRGVSILAVVAMAGVQSALAAAPAEAGPLPADQGARRRRASPVGLTAEQAEAVAQSMVALHPYPTCPACDDSYRDPQRLAEDVRVLDVLPAGGLLPEGAALIVAGRGGIGEPWERLCFRSADQFAVIDYPAKLAGLVRVTTPEDAVRFARLATSPSLVKCFPPPWWVEVVPSAQADTAFLFRRSHPWPVAPAKGGGGWPSGFYGVLSDADWARTGLEDLEVVEGDDGYVITRPLFCDPMRGLGSNAVYIVRETVTRQGKLTREIVERRELPGIWLIVWVHR